MKVDIGGDSTYAYTGGRPFVPGRPYVVFVHGAAQDHSVWALQSRYFAHHGFNALALDLPGHGRSDGRALDSVEALAVWLVAMLDAVDIPRALLVGHSMGALGCLELAAKAPERARGLALLGPAVPMAVSDELLAAARDDEQLAYEMINAWSFGPARQLGANAVPGLWLTGNSLRLMQRNRPGVLATDLRACAAYEGGLHAARAVQCPTLLVIGARDLMAPAKVTPDLIAALRSPQVVTLPGAGHSMMAEEPDAVLDALRAFARALTRARDANPPPAAEKTPA